MSPTRAGDRSAKRSTAEKPRAAAPVGAVAPLQGVRGRARAVVEGIRPQVDGGRFPAKRETGDVVEVEADVYADGHDEVAAELRWRHEREKGW
ncbi:MAG: DUF3416 domain-containing protein, partial [Acidobacteriota bacterium]|nr:DUF3416 domain-containing protein [Acidobacteriota bacterium]